MCAAVHAVTILCAVPVFRMHEFRCFFLFNYKTAHARVDRLLFLSLFLPAFVIVIIFASSIFFVLVRNHRERRQYMNTIFIVYGHRWQSDPIRRYPSVVRTFMKMSSEQ